MSEKEVGTDPKGRRMIVSDGKLVIVAPGGQRVTLSRRHIEKTIEEYKGEIAKYEMFLAAIDSEEKQ